MGYVYPLVDVLVVWSTSKNFTYHKYTSKPDSGVLP